MHRLLPIKAMMSTMMLLLTSMTASAQLSTNPDKFLGNITTSYQVDYGKEKYSGSTLFWIGFMYRYISYTREIPTRFIAKLFHHRQMNDVYYSFHTQDPEWCIRSLLEINLLSDHIFDNNYKLKETIREKKYA